MTLPNSEGFDPNLVTNATLANTIDDKIMAVVNLVADILGVDMGAQRTVNTALASFNTSTGKFETLAVEGASGVNGVIIKDTSGGTVTYRITADTSADDTFYIDKYNGATWDPLLHVDATGVYHYGMAAYLGDSTITEITAGVGLSGGGTDGTVNIDIENLGVGTAQLADDAVTADKLAANAVVDANVAAAAAIDGSKFKDASIEEIKIKTTAITDANLLLRANASGGAEWAQATTASIADGVITTAKLDAQCVTVAAMNSEAATSGHVLKSNGVGFPPSYGQVGTAGIADANVTEAKIADGAVTTDKIGANKVTAAKIERNSNTGYVLASNGALADPSWQSIGTVGVADNSITLAKLYHGSSTAPDGYPLCGNGDSVNPAYEQLATGGIADLAVTAAKIAANTITTAKLYGGTSGYPLVGAGAGVTPSYTKLAATGMIGTGGSINQILTNQGSSASPTWEDAPSSYSGKVIRLYATPSVPNNTNTDISWTTETYDTGNSVTVPDTTIRVSETGYYLIHVQGKWDATTESGDEFGFLTVSIGGAANGGYDYCRFAEWNGMSDGPTLQSTIVYSCTTATDIGAIVYQNTGSSLGFTAYLTIVKVA